MKVYVASSWRNKYQQEVVAAIRQHHEVYDFRNPAPGNHGFAWSSIDPSWQSWSPLEYLEALSHPLAESGFKLDMDALRWCDACVMVMPCGPSASMEMGWCAGAGKKVAIYIPEIREPDLMVKMADWITTDLEALTDWLLQDEVVTPMVGSSGEGPT